MSGAPEQSALLASRRALAGREAWLVGGLVRDRELGRETADVDVVVAGVTGVSTGTFGWPLDAVVVLPPTDALVLAAAPLDANPALAAGCGEASAAGDAAAGGAAVALDASGASATGPPASLAMLAGPPDVAPPLVPV